jgi:SNF family Na+-dependent transporter
MVTKFTMTMPWFLLTVFIIHNATLEGASDGVKAYIGEWNLEVLKSGDAWSDAAGQIFFTLGATLGVCPPSTPDPL